MIMKSETSVQALDLIKRVIEYDKKDSFVSLHEPDFSDSNALTYVSDCINSGWVSSAGSYVGDFEESIASFVGSEFAIAVSNGTVALRLALHIAGVKPGEEVITSPFSFVATANAISHLGASPEFVDIESDSLGIDPTKLDSYLSKYAKKRDGHIFNKETGRRIAAVVPVHVFGKPCKIVELSSVCRIWGIPIVEDSAEALGSSISGTHCGLFGEVGAISFNGNKIITTGGGGVLVTNDAQLAKTARHLSTTAKLPHAWEFVHDRVGWNDRMPNINAALGLSQIEVLQRVLDKKRQVYESYLQAFSSFTCGHIICEGERAKSNHWLVSLRFDQPDIVVAEAQAMELLRMAHESNIGIRPAWKPLHLLPMYRNNYRCSLSITEEEARRIVSLPSSPILAK